MTLLMEKLLELTSIKTIWFIITFTSLLSAQNFFPSRIGDKYMVKGKVDTYGWPLGWQGSQATLSYGIDRDSIINGERYIGFNTSRPTWQNFYTPYLKNLFRFNEEEQILYVILPFEYEPKIAVNFNMAAGGSFTSYIMGQPREFSSSGLMTRLVFGELKLSYEINSSTTTSDTSETFRFVFYQDIGLGEFNYYFRNQWQHYIWVRQYEDSLISAAVNNVFYNPVTLQITGLSPLENRRAKDFPFSVKSEYETNMDMVDTFYLESKLVRGTDTLESGTYSFNQNPYFLAPVPYRPLPGDKVLLKAHIRDSSIFMNYDSYPELGYAQIFVLPNEDSVFVLPSENLLYQNYPNPFNSGTRIRYAISEPAFTTLIIYNSLGKEIARPVSEEKLPGEYYFNFDGSDFASGVYFYKLTAGENTIARKMLLMK